MDQVQAIHQADPPLRDLLQQLLRILGHSIGIWVISHQAGALLKYREIETRGNSLKFLSDPDGGSDAIWQFVSTAGALVVITV